MLSKWSEHLKLPKDREDFNKYVLGSKALLNRLSEILEEKEQSLDYSETALETYDHNNWPYRQAHKNGYRSAIRSIKHLIDPDHFKENK